jgi:hypothetical protein
MTLTQLYIGNIQYVHGSKVGNKTTVNAEECDAGDVHMC